MGIPVSLFYFTDIIIMQADFKNQYNLVQVLCHHCLFLYRGMQWAKRFQ